MVSRVCSVVEDALSEEKLYVLSPLPINIRSDLSLTPDKSRSAPILQGRTLPEYIAPLLRADAKSYTDAKSFVQRNSTFFTTHLSRPSYHPAFSPASSSSAPTTVPMQLLHTAAAALTLVPSTHWTIETHRANINYYDGGAAIETSSPPSSTEEEPLSPAAGNKLFKKELYHYLRWALSGSAPGPGIPETITILGREETVRRLQDAKAQTAKLVPPAGGRVPKSSGSSGDRSWMGSLASGR